MSDHNTGGRGRDFLLGAVVGSVLGAVTALLLAPKSGKELRADLSEQVQQVSEKTQKIAGTVGLKTQEIAKQVSAQTGEWMQKAKEVVENVTDEVREWRESRRESAAAGDEMMPADAVVLPQRKGRVQ